MNNLKVLLGMIIVVWANYSIIVLRDVRLLGCIFVGLYVFGYCTQSKRVVVQRLQTFAFIGISLLVFQLLLNQSVPIVVRFIYALRTTLQIASISQLIFLAVRYVSPSALIRSLGFLPRTWQLLLTMTFTFIPVLVQEQGNIQVAQRSRGLGLSWRSRLIAPIASYVPLIHRILQRSETIGFTLLSRGFVEK
jgi:energy-coupling factor transporter transmembrane protein EcfT